MLEEEPAAACHSPAGSELWVPEEQQTAVGLRAGGAVLEVGRVPGPRSAGLQDRILHEVWPWEGCQQDCSISQRLDCEMERGKSGKREPSFEEVVCGGGR